MLKNSLQKISSSLNTISKTMKVNKNVVNVKELLHSRVLLYVFLFISLLHLFYYVNTGDFRAVSVFIIIGFLTSFFSKNMLIILLVALLVTHVMKFGFRSLNEGAKNKDDEEEEEGFTEGVEEEEEKEGMEGMEEEEGKEGMEDEEEEKKEGMKEGKDKGTVPPKAKGGVSPMNEKDLDSDKKKDYLEFQKLQTEIMTNMQKLEPLISKAESFVEKYHEKYGNK
jgi:hypothetical protein